MKRVVILAAAMATAFGVQAQTVKELERAGFLRDSVLEVLAQYRANYAKEQAKRKELAPKIIELEGEATRLQAEYEKIVGAIAQKDAREAVVAYDKFVAGAKGVRPNPDDLAGGEEMLNNGEMKRDLVANKIFIKRLTSADYATLLKAQQEESKVQAMVADYMVMYGDLLALQRKYMEMPTKDKADKVAVQFKAKEKELEALESDIAKIWSPLYCNKTYAYDLFMERYGNTAMLDLSAEIAMRAEREVNENSDQYQSNTLVDYYVRKKALTEYEMKVAAMLNLTLSSDSLSVVMSELRNRDFRISKLSLPHRSFIVYENVEIKVPSIYNSKNPIPRTKVYDSGVVYRVRVGLYSSRPAISSLRGATPLSYSETLHTGYYAYFVGGFRTEKEAQKSADYLKKVGFREPIVAVWVDGKYYPTVDEMRLSENLYTLEISGVASLSGEMKSCIFAQKSDCTISRSGSTFVVGIFEDRALAESIAADLKAIDSAVTVEVTKKP